MGRCGGPFLLKPNEITSVDLKAEEITCHWNEYRLVGAKSNSQRPFPLLSPFPRL
jgi:hypothetical protein